MLIVNAVNQSQNSSVYDILTDKAEFSCRKICSTHPQVPSFDVSSDVGGVKEELQANSAWISPQILDNQGVQNLISLIAKYSTFSKNMIVEDVIDEHFG